MQAESYRVVMKKILDVDVTITSYRIDAMYYCHVANYDPGAVIARTEAATREEAETMAIAKTTERLKKKK
ncbi:MAG: hypothetical protein ALAOOOJD_00010 [bacterium]|nr:hypothetical protein [bacterium]